MASFPVAGNDYTGRQNVEVSFDPSQLEQTVFVDVLVNDDQLLEGEEQFFGVLSLPAGSTGVVLGEDRATATIQDNDGESTVQRER